MALDLEYIRNYYANVSDDKLQQIVMHEMASLEPEAQQILVAEVDKRGLKEKWDKAIKAQSTPLTKEQKTNLLKHIRSQPCPRCDSQDVPLTGGQVRIVRSFLIPTLSSKRYYILCPDCLANEQSKNLILNFLLGWWAPFGLIQTPRALLGHASDRSPDNSHKIDKEVFEGFLSHYLGEIATSIDDEDELVNLLANFNSKI